MKITKIGAAAAAIVATLALSAASCQTGGGTQPVQQEQPDCDAGDLRESKPDPDCGGLWLGTPAPKVTVRKTFGPAPRPLVRTRR